LIISSRTLHPLSSDYHRPKASNPRSPNYVQPSGICRPLFTLLSSLRRFQSVSALFTRLPYTTRIPYTRASPRRHIIIINRNNNNNDNNLSLEVVPLDNPQLLVLVVEQLVLLFLVLHHQPSVHQHQPSGLPPQHSVLQHQHSVPPLLVIINNHQLSALPQLPLEQLLPPHSAQLPSSKVVLQIIQLLVPPSLEAPTIIDP